MRHFYCVDVLWSLFDEMSAEFDCSIDYLINEAMRYYARSKKRIPVSPSPPPAPDSRVRVSPTPRPTETASAPDGRARVSPTPRPIAADGSPPRARGPTPSPPPRPAPNQASPSPRPLPRPPAPPPPAEGARAAGTLVLVFNQQPIAITKDQFIIGRKHAGSDLVIKDGNISRQHAAIVRRNGAYYLKDLGSTNGITFRGMRIDHKRIDEGDIFNICDYELRFTYRGGQ